MIKKVQKHGNHYAAAILSNNYQFLQRVEVRSLCWGRTCVAPNRTSIACALKALGIIHDSKKVELESVYRDLENIYHRAHATCVVDSAFDGGHYKFL